MTYESKIAHLDKNKGLNDTFPKLSTKSLGLPKWMEFMEMI